MSHDSSACEAAYQCFLRKLYVIELVTTWVNKVIVQRMAEISLVNEMQKW